MTKRLQLPGAVAVEGSSDQKIFAAWFPQLQFEAVNGKTRVRSHVTQNSTRWGILDRDFTDNPTVEASQRGESRLIILRRYCIENYLLEPAIISDVARSLLHLDPKLKVWTDEVYVREKLIEWAKELSLYASANALISQWRSIIEDDFLQYFGPLPPLPRDGVLEQLSNRLDHLPASSDVEAKLDAVNHQILTDITELDGVHRWINGKILLEDVLFPQVFNLHNLGKTRLRDELIEAGRTHIPSELIQLAQKLEARRF